MKKHGFTLGLMILLIMGSLGTAHATDTLVVKKDGSGPGAYSTVASAVAVAVAGDTIEIQDSGVYDETTSINLVGVNLKCTAVQRATIMASGTTPGVDQVSILIDATESTIENVKLRGITGVFQIGLNGAGSVNIKNCFIQDFTFAGPIRLQAKSGKVLSGALEGSSVVNCAGSTIYFQGTGDPAPTAANVGSFLIDHCTILSLGQGNVCLAANFPTNGGSITVKNSVLGLFDKSKPLGTGYNNCYYINSPFMTEWNTDSYGQPVAGAHSSNDINHSYNAYIGLWYLKWNWMDIDYASGDYNSEVGPTEIAPFMPYVIDPGFTDPFNYDLSVKDRSKLIGKGEGGSTLGAFQSHVAPGPQIIVKQDGTGDFTTIEAAVTAATFGDLIEIGDSGTYDLAMDLHLIGKNLRGAKGQRPTIKHTAGGDTGRLIYEMANTSLENLTLLAHATAEQMGIPGSGHWVIKNCTFKGFKQSCALIMGALPGTKLYGEISGCTFIDCDSTAISGVLTFAGWASPTASEVGPFLIDHCTFLGSGTKIFLANGYPTDGSNITLKNSILANYTGGAYVAAKPFVAAALSQIKIVHKYNVYYKLDAIGFGFVLDPTELANFDPQFKDIASGDFSVPDNSILLWWDENGSAMGVDYGYVTCPQPPLISDLALADAEPGVDGIHTQGINVEFHVSRALPSAIDIDEDPAFGTPTTLPYLRSYINIASCNYAFDSSAYETKTVYARVRNSAGTSNVLSATFNLTPPAIVWANFAWAGAEFGSQAQPFNTLAECVTNVLAGGTIKLVGPSATSAKMRLAKALRLEAVGGKVRVGVIGAPPVTGKLAIKSAKVSAATQSGQDLPNPAGAPPVPVELSEFQVD